MRILTPTNRFYFHWKRVEIGDDILQILYKVEYLLNSPHLEKNSFRALRSASCCNDASTFGSTAVVQNRVIDKIAVMISKANCTERVVHT